MNCKAQQVIIKGYIRNSANEKISASITVNDTINKLKKLDSTNFTIRDKVVNEKKVVTYNNEKGYFTITAKPTDSLFFRFGHFYHAEKYLVSDFMKTNKIIVPKSIPCIPVKKCDQKTYSRLYKFIGKKIDVSFVDTTLYCGGMLWDSKYKAEYKIEKEFGEQYSNSSMIFTAYDHASMYEYNFKNHDNI